MRKIFCALLFAVLLCSCANAQLDEATVQRAWEKIAKTDNFKPIKITYEKDESPNAWVAFKSQNDFSVHVTQGLMKILNSEDEIAGVLGHEIGHVRLGHYKSGVTRNVGWSLLSTVLSKKVGTIGQAVGSVGMNLAESGFSRGQEVEADDYGTELLVKAGYPSDGLYRAMKAFADNKYVTQPSGFNSHPPTERRLQHLYEKSQSLKK